MLEAFMEERNMRWGELIGGMLFVGGGIALAISLRNRLATVPYWQFLIFAVIAAAVYGMGLYAHHRWRLATTSRGMLMIGVLLTPLSFLIMADLSNDYGRLLSVSVEAASLAVFGLLLWPTMKILVPKGRLLGTVGVLGQSAVMLCLARLGENANHIWLTVAACPFAGRNFRGRDAGVLCDNTIPNHRPRRWIDEARGWTCPTRWDCSRCWARRPSPWFLPMASWSCKLPKCWAWTTCSNVWLRPLPWPPWPF